MADQSNPWDTAPAADSAAQSADAWGTPASAPTDGGGADWLNSAPAPQAEHFNIMDPFHKTLIPLDSWVTHGIDWIVVHFRPLFQGIRVPVDYILSAFQQLLLGMPAPVAIVLFALIAWQISSVGMGVATLISLVAIGAIGAWSQAMVTLALVLTALLFCMLIGLPLGIWLARSPRAAKIIRPLLDAMQTTPAFVYLVPIVMLFGIGNVPGVVVTIIFALPPIVRLTILGINQVPADLIEASRSFGASPRQLLFKVQLPLAMPTIMAGVNQTLMLALSMVVIASMIAVGGLCISLAYMLYFGAIVLLPQLLQEVYGYTATWAGLASAPVGVIPVILSPIIGRFAHKLDMRRLVTFSFIMYAVCFYWRAWTFEPGMDFGASAWPQFIQGFAVACFFMPLTTITLSGLPPERLAAASSLSNFTRTLAGSIGTSITTTMWTNREALHHAQLTESVTPYNPNAQQMYDQLQGLGMTQQQASGWIAQQITNQGLIISANEIFWFSAAIFILLLGLVWFARPPFSAGGGGGGAH